MWPVAFFAMIVLASQPFDQEMSKDEKKETGISKLNKKEKKALQAWIDTHCLKKEVSQGSVDKKAANRPMIEESLQGGRYIRLSDQTLWEINPQDTLITQSWISPVEITVTQTGNQDYPYTLTNSLTGSSVRAKKASDVSSKPAMPSPKKPQILPAPAQPKQQKQT